MPGEERDLRCNGCGQGWHLRQTDVYNETPPTFCPNCGTPTLVRETAHFGTGAKAFAGYNADLVTGLYQVWRDYRGRAHDAGCGFPYRRFVDWFRGCVSHELDLTALLGPDEEDEDV